MVMNMNAIRKIKIIKYYLRFFFFSSQLLTKITSSLRGELGDEFQQNTNNNNLCPKIYFPFMITE